MKLVGAKRQYGRVTKSNKSPRRFGFAAASQAVGIPPGPSLHYTHSGYLPFHFF